MFFESLVGPIRQNYERDKQSVSVSMHDLSHINCLLTKNCKKVTITLVTWRLPMVMKCNKFNKGITCTV